MIILQNTEKNKRKAASKNIFTSQNIPIHDPKIDNSG